MMDINPVWRFGLKPDSLFLADLHYQPYQYMHDDHRQINLMLAIDGPMTWLVGLSIMACWAYHGMHWLWKQNIFHKLNKSSRPNITSPALPARYPTLPMLPTATLCSIPTGKVSYSGGGGVWAIYPGMNLTWK
jgi:hypothetical protein